MRIIISTASQLRYGTKMDDGWHIDTDELSVADRRALQLWLDRNPGVSRPDPTPAPTPEPEPEQEYRRRPPAKADVVERKALHVPFVDPIAQDLKNSISQQIATQQMNERFTEYQIQQGLVDDSHNAALIQDWIQKYGQGHGAVANIDRAIRALRPQLHWKQLSAFTKRLAGF
jgi:hypothetical protein